MINDKLIDVFLQCAEQKDLIKGIKQILNHFKLENEYQYEELIDNLVNIIGGDKPITIDDILQGSPKVFDLDNLVCVSHNTHNAIHYSDDNLLMKDPIERKPNDTCPWKNI